MARKNFPKQVRAARFEACGGRCEGIKDDGTRCNVVLVAGRWHGDHDTADALGGEPTFENCRCLCLDCHAKKTKVDDEAIARAKRQQEAHLGIRNEPVRKIQSRGFPKKAKRAPRPGLPPKVLYVKDSDHV